MHGVRQGERRWGEGRGRGGVSYIALTGCGSSSGIKV